MNLKSKIWNSNLKNLLLINSRTFWDGDNWPNYNWKNDLKSRGKKKKDLEHSARSQKRVRVDWWLRELAQFWRFYFDHQSYLKSIRKSLSFKSFGPGGRTGQAGCGILFILCHALGGERLGGHSGLSLIKKWWRLKYTKIYRTEINCCNTSCHWVLGHWVPGWFQCWHQAFGRRPQRHLVVVFETQSDKFL